MVSLPSPKRQAAPHTGHSLELDGISLQEVSCPRSGAISLCLPRIKTSGIQFLLQSPTTCQKNLKSTFKTTNQLRRIPRLAHITTRRSQQKPTWTPLCYTTPICQQGQWIQSHLQQVSSKLYGSKSVHYGGPIWKQSIRIRSHHSLQLSLPTCNRKFVCFIHYKRKCYHSTAHLTFIPIWKRTSHQLLSTASEPISRHTGQS
jgi:hypothetical protein